MADFFFIKKHNWELIILGKISILYYINQGLHNLWGVNIQTLETKNLLDVSSNIGGCQGCPPRVATVDDAKAGLETVVPYFLKQWFPVSRNSGSLFLTTVDDAKAVLPR